MYLLEALFDAEIMSDRIAPLIHVDSTERTIIRKFIHDGIVNFV